MFFAVGSLRLERSLANNHRAGVGSRMIAGSLNKLKRKGFTAFKLFGPPKLYKTTAVLFMSLYYASNSQLDHKELTHFLVAFAEVHHDPD